MMGLLAAAAAFTIAAASKLNHERRSKRESS